MEEARSVIKLWSGAEPFISTLTSGLRRQFVFFIFEPKKGGGL